MAGQGRNAQTRDVRYGMCISIPPNALRGEPCPHDASDHVYTLADVGQQVGVFLTHAPSGDET
jgi:hypothetical protein